MPATPATAKKLKKPIQTRVSAVDPVTGEPETYPLGHGLTPLAISCLPEATRISLIEETCAVQSESLLKKLLAAKAFQVKLKSEERPLSNEIRLDMTAAFTALTAVTQVFSQCKSYLLALDTRTGNSFNSSVAYEIQLMPVNEDFRDVFREVVAQFIASVNAVHSASFKPFARSGVFQGDFVNFESKAIATCGPLMCAAVGLNDLQSLNALIDMLKGMVHFPAGQDKNFPLFRRTVLNHKLFVSEKIFPESLASEKRDQLFLSPVEVAIRMNRANALQVFIDNGFQADTDSVNFPAMENDDGGGGFAAATSPGRLPAMMADGKISMTPAVAEVVLCGMGLGSRTPSDQMTGSTLGRDLTRWVCKLVAGDEHEVDLVRVAHQHGLVSINPLECFNTAIVSGSVDLLRAACDSLNWNDIPVHVPAVYSDSKPWRGRASYSPVLSHLMHARSWVGSEPDMLKFTEVLIDTVSAAGRVDLLKGIALHSARDLPVGRGMDASKPFTLLQFLAGKGHSAALFKALELGLDPEEHCVAGAKPIERAIELGQPRNADLIRSHLTRKAALKVVDDLVSSAPSATSSFAETPKKAAKVCP